jgi:hypothetical protein
LIKISAATPVIIIMMLSASFLATPLWAGSGPQIGTAQGGAMGTSSAPRDVDLGALPQVTAHEIAATPLYNHRPLDGRTDAQYEFLKAQAARQSAPGHGTAVPAGGKGGPQFAGLINSFIAQQEICCTPPDMALAAGNGFVVQFINTFIAVYAKNGNLASGFPKSAVTFFNLPAGTYTTDPRGFFDQLNRRFVFTMLTESNPTSGTNTGALLIAASKTADPRGGWWVFNPITIGNAGECPDYDTLGNDST